MKIFRASLIMLIVSCSSLTSYAVPSTAPVGSSAPVGGIFSQIFSNISSPVPGGLDNPLIIGFNPPPSNTPIFLAGSVFITNYLRTLGALPTGQVVTGFTPSGDITSGVIDTMVKDFLNGILAGSGDVVTGFDPTGNVITGHSVGFWSLALPSGIEYTDGDVIIGGNLKITGNASSSDASDPRHLVTLQQVRVQMRNICETFGHTWDGASHSCTP